MANILAVGGVFFKCKDVEGYRAWWAKYMGAELTDWGTLESVSYTHLTLPTTPYV